MSRRIKMSEERLAQFKDQNYLSLETFRKNGAGVRTPVWFAEDEGVLYVYSLADAGKVKRVRNNSRVRVAPCGARGAVKGDWVEAQATILDDAGAELGHRLLNRKYGMLKRIGDFFSGLRKRKRVVMAIRVL
jgi:PPOX class probable F420-dependent enzyme